MKKRSEIILRHCAKACCLIGQALGVFCFAFPVCFILVVLVQELLK